MNSDNQQHLRKRASLIARPPQPYVGDLPTRPLATEPLPQRQRVPHTSRSVRTSGDALLKGKGSNGVSAFPSRTIVSFLFGVVILLALPVTVLLVTHQGVTQGHAASSANVVVDYTQPLRHLDPIAIGMDESGYAYPNVLANDTLEQQRIKTLGLGYMRMDLKYTTAGDSTSRIICGGSGCDSRWTGDQWISAIKSTGAEPVVIVWYNPTDAANMVKHFNQDTKNPVHYWMIGNEPDLNGISASTYSTSFNRDYDAMKAVDPTIQVGGATTAWYDTGFFDTFLQQSGSRVDFVDFHGYPQQGTTPGASTTLFQKAAEYGANINDLRARLQRWVPSRASQIAIEVGEWDLNWGGSAQDNMNFHALWTADVLGTILQAGGHSLFYATKGNALYMNAETVTDSSGHAVQIKGDDTNPSYHGSGMFTGEGLFRHFGTTMVHASSMAANVDVFASDNPKNIVMVNKDPGESATITVRLAGVTSGTIAVWRKDESVVFTNPPVPLETMQFANGTFSYQLTPFSATTFLVNPAPTLTPPASSPTLAATSTTTPLPTQLTPTSSPTGRATPTPAPHPVSGTVIAQDTFQRPDQAQWGRASDGHLWGADADTLNHSFIRNHTGSVANAYDTASATLGSAATNADVLFTGSMSSYTDSNVGSVLRFTDTNNWYKAYIDGNHVVVQKKVNGSTTILASAPFTATANTLYSLRFRIVGTTLYAKAWPAGNAEPAMWAVTATDSTFTVGYCGLRSLTQQGVTASYRSFTAIRL
jgi:Glycosyl hydrolases family 39